jgi:hypothetical protein
MKAMAANTIRATATLNIAEVIAIRFGLFTRATSVDSGYKQIDYSTQLPLERLEKT